jgi:hypothetical protein
MARIVAVHGIGQQYKGEDIIHREWWPALRSGLRLAGLNLEDERALACPFYGHLFRPEGSLAIGSTGEDPASLTPEEQRLLELWWEEAAVLEPAKVKSPEYYDPARSLARTPMLVQRALSALTQCSFFAGLYRTAIMGNLRQVTLYLSDRQLNEQVRAIVRKAITDETRVVVGHSLGSVVAYEELCRESSFVTLGSPLGIRNLIFDRRTPAASSGQGVWPGRVEHWTNVADRGDVVALEKKLSVRFGPKYRILASIAVLMRITVSAI